MFDFINLNIIDVLDTILVAILIYQFIRLTRGTAAINIFLGILILYITWIVVTALNMSLISSILGQVLGLGVISLIIIFQQEIRRFILHIGQDYLSSKRAHRIFNAFFNRNVDSVPYEILEDIGKACQRMSENRTGALIILSTRGGLDYIVQTGDTIDASINQRLIENIFFKNSPLHDGAMVISGNRILAARCTLPITENPNIPAQYGMRHRAAVSITQEANVDAIVVSEETGNITFVSKGIMKTMSSISELKLKIENSYKQDGGE